jgi:outer membrane protein assembly factor BamB
MKRNWLRSLFCLPLAAVLVCPVQAGDWLRFRGPDGSGIAPDNLPVPTKFSPTENLKWKCELPGAGVSCPIVVGDKVFVTCYTGYGVDRENLGEMKDLKRHLVCVSRTDGKILWTKSVDAVLPEDEFKGAGVPQHGYASHTPVSDGKNVFCYFGKSGVYAYDLDGNELWHASAGTGSDDPKWGSSSSPIEFGNLVIITASAESRALIAYDKTTGKEVWREQNDGLNGVWGTPTLAKVKDGQTDLVIAVPNEVWGLNPETGKLRWFVDFGPPGGAPSGGPPGGGPPGGGGGRNAPPQYNSSAVVADGLVFALEGRAGKGAIKLGGADDVTKSHVAWQANANARFGTPLVYEGKVYLISSGIVNVLDAKSGERVYQKRLDGSEAPAGGPGGPGGGRGGPPGGGPPGGAPGAGGPPPGGGQQGGGRGGPPGGGFGGGQRGGGGGRGGMGGDYSSPVLADGKIYFVTRGGDIHVIKPGDKFESLAVNRVTPDREDFSATPAVCNGELLIRSNKALYCVGETK